MKTTNIPDDVNPCDICKYTNKGIDEVPCNQCVHAATECFEPMSNFDWIKNMSLSELADFICDIYASNEHHEIRVNGKWILPEDVEEWLERDVD